MMQKAIKNDIDFTELIMNIDYYLTNLDILMLADIFNVPLVIYSGTKLQETNKPILVFNPESNIQTKPSAYYFIKAPGILPNKNPKYRLIIKAAKNKTKILINVEDLNDPKETSTIKLKNTIQENSFDLNSYIDNYTPKKSRKRRLILV